MDTFFESLTNFELIYYFVICSIIITGIGNIYFYLCKRISNGISKLFKRVFKK